MGVVTSNRRYKKCRSSVGTPTSVFIFLCRCCCFQARIAGSLLRSERRQGKTRSENTDTPALSRSHMKRPAGRPATQVAKSAHCATHKRDRSTVLVLGCSYHRLVQTRALLFSHSSSFQFGGTHLTTVVVHVARRTLPRSYQTSVPGCSYRTVLFFQRQTVPLANNNNRDMSNKHTKTLIETATRHVSSTACFLTLILPLTSWNRRAGAALTSLLGPCPRTAFSALRRTGQATCATTRKQKKPVRQ